MLLNRNTIKEFRSSHRVILSVVLGRVLKRSLLSVGLNGFSCSAYILRQLPRISLSRSSAADPDQTLILRRLISRRHNGVLAARKSKEMASHDMC